MKLPKIQIAESGQRDGLFRLEVNGKTVGPSMDDHTAFKIAGFLIMCWKKLLKAAGINK